MELHNSKCGNPLLSLRKLEKCHLRFSQNFPDQVEQKSVKQI